MVRNHFCNLAIGSGCEREAAAAGFLLPQEIENRLPVRKPGRIEMRLGGEFPFERGASREQPNGEKENEKRSGFEEHQDALPQHVAADQCAVKVDAQDGPRDLGRLGSSDCPHGLIVAYGVGSNAAISGTPR